MTKVNTGINREIKERLTYVANIEAEGLATNGLQDVVERRLVQERQVDHLDVWERRHKLHAHAQKTAEAHVLD